MRLPLLPALNFQFISYLSSTAFRGLIAQVFIEEGIACGFQSNDKQKTKKELTIPYPLVPLTSALNYLRGCLPFLAKRIQPEQGLESLI